MKTFTAILASLVLLMTAHSVLAQNKAVDPALEARYGEHYQEILQKFGDEPLLLERAEAEARKDRSLPWKLAQRLARLGDQYVVRDEMEANNYFDTADNINDVLATMAAVRPDEANGGLIRARLDSGDVDVYRFTVDTTKMYYFASTHSFYDDGMDELDVSARLFHMSDLDTTFVENFGGSGVDKMQGDIIGEPGDGRNGSYDFRMTGWVSPVDSVSGQMLTGDFYLWVFSDEAEVGPYHLVAYSIDREPWVNKLEPNQSNVDVLTGGILSRLPTDAVVRTFMLFNPDTLKNQELGGGFIQANSAYPVLLGRGDEDVDHYLFDYKAGHNVVIETLPYFGWYRDNDGTIGPGGSRLSDPRILVYDGDYTKILYDNDDGAREQMDGPNNIHSRIVLTPDKLLDDHGISEDTPLWLWVSAWASTTRDPEFGTVNNNDPGRLMYQVYLHQYSSDPSEVEPNNSAAEATSIAARSDTSSAGMMDAGDEDWYRVFLHQVRMYTLFVSDPAVQIELYHETEPDMPGPTEMSGNLLSADQVVGGLVTGYSPEQSGAYLVKLSGGSGAYQFGVVDKGVIWDGLIAHEPDNTPAEVADTKQLPVGPGAPAVNAMIYPAGDIDGYHFSVEAGTDITLTLSGTQDIVADFAGTMALVAPDGSILGSSAEGISITAPASGSYGVVVQSEAIGFYKLSGGEPFEEMEANNTFETANLIATGESFVYDAALTAGDVDFFKMELEAGKLYSFRSKDNETGANLDVEFYDEANGTTLLDESSWVDNYGGNFKIASIIPREDKTYYLRISGSPGKYKVASRVNDNYLALQHKGEPNNSKTEADAQGDYQVFGPEVAYVLSEPAHPRFFGDEDWFRVAHGAGQTVSARTDPVGANRDDWNRDTDTRIIILDETGTTELVNDDDGGNAYYSSGSYTAEADGHVYVVVTTSYGLAGGNDRNADRGDYNLTINVGNEEVEPNNTFAEADGNVLAGGFVDAAFDEAGGQTDIYKLALQADWIYHFRTSRLEGGYSGPFVARLVKASDTGSNLLSDDLTGYNSRYSWDGNESNVKINFIPDEAGDYYLELTGDGEGTYQVGMKGRDISELKSKGEPNNTVAEADAIGPQEFDQPGEAQTYMLFNENFEWDPTIHQITSRWGDDIDIYRYDLVVGDTLLAESSSVDGPLWRRDYDGYMRLLSATGDTLLSNDDGRNIDWHSRIEFIPEEAGSYYVMLHSQDYGPASRGHDRDPSRGEYNLTVLKMDGSVIRITDVTPDEVPAEFVLHQNYPNPFNPTTTITYSLPEAREVQLAVFNVLGQRVELLVDQVQSGGTYSVQYNASRLASGTYFYQLRAGNLVQTKQMFLIK